MYLSRNPLSLSGTSIKPHTRNISYEKLYNKNNDNKVITYTIPDFNFSPPQLQTIKIHSNQSKYQNGNGIKSNLDSKQYQSNQQQDVMRDIDPKNQFMQKIRLQNIEGSSTTLLNQDLLITPWQSGIGYFSPKVQTPEAPIMNLENQINQYQSLDDSILGYNSSITGNKVHTDNYKQMIGHKLKNKKPSTSNREQIQQFSTISPQQDVLSSTNMTESSKAFVYYRPSFIQQFMHPDSHQKNNSQTLFSQTKKSFQNQDQNLNNQPNSNKIVTGNIPKIITTQKSQIFFLDKRQKQNVVNSPTQMKIINLKQVNGKSPNKKQSSNKEDNQSPSKSQNNKSILQYKEIKNLNLYDKSLENDALNFQKKFQSQNNKNKSINLSQIIDQSNEQKINKSIKQDDEVIELSKQIIDQAHQIDHKVKKAFNGYVRAISQGNQFLLKMFKQNAELYNIRQTNYAYYYNNQKQQLYEIRNKALVQSPKLQVSHFQTQPSQNNKIQPKQIMNSNLALSQTSDNLFQKSLMNTQIVVEDGELQSRIQSRQNDFSMSNQMIFQISSNNDQENSQNQIQNQQENLSQDQVQSSQDSLNYKERDSSDDNLNFKPRKKKGQRDLQRQMQKSISQKEGVLLQSQLSIPLQIIHQNSSNQGQNQESFLFPNSNTKQKGFDPTNGKRQSFLMDQKQLKLILFNHLKDKDQPTQQINNQECKNKQQHQKQKTNDETELKNIVQQDQQQQNEAFSENFSLNESLSPLKTKTSSIINHRRQTHLFSRQLSPISPEEKKQLNQNKNKIISPITTNKMLHRQSSMAGINQNDIQAANKISTSFEQIDQNVRHSQQMYQQNISNDYHNQTQTGQAVVQNDKLLHSKSLKTANRRQNPIELDQLPQFQQAYILRENKVYPTANKKHRDINDERYEFYEFLKRKWKNKHDLYKYIEFKNSISNKSNPYTSNGDQIKKK